MPESILYAMLHKSTHIVICMTSLQVDVVEIHVAQTDAMSTCQTSLLDLIDACVKELKRCNQSVSIHSCSYCNIYPRPPVKG